MLNIEGQLPFVKCHFIFLIHETGIIFCGNKMTLRISNCLIDRLSHIHYTISQSYKILVRPFTTLKCLALEYMMML